MNSDLVISAVNLGKRYKRYDSRITRLADWLTGGRICRYTEEWALRGLNFQLRRGESLGVVGQNGAGKSTLLKMLSGTVRPTEGTVAVNGRIAAILELGMGFHPDYSGYQNAIMACQLQGWASDEIEQLIPQIEAFAELQGYMGQPVRTYSSGMQMRLAFSVVTAKRPNVLIVDEALSVGDLYFSHKCVSRIRDFKQEGTTLLFVSHDPGAVKTLCDRALLIDKGVLLRDDTPDAVLDYYNAMIAKREADAEIRQVETTHGHRETRSGNRRASIEDVESLDSRGHESRSFRVGEMATLRIAVAVHDVLEDLTVGILLRDRLGNDVFGTNSYHVTEEINAVEPGRHIFEFDLGLELGYGSYSVTVALHKREHHLEENYDWWDSALVFQVFPGSEKTFVGTAALQVAFRKVTTHG
ncbi:MAG TPA: ABC transporter ATP-binding protein [Gammaproteobacteria bacterium]